MPKKSIKHHFDSRPDQPSQVDTQKRIKKEIYYFRNGKCFILEFILSARKMHVLFGENNNDSPAKRASE